MTRLLYIFIVFFIINSCFGQSDTTSPPANKIILGVNAGSLSANSNALNHNNAYIKEKWILNYYAYCTIEKGESFFAAGPVLSPHLEKKYDWDHNKEYEQYRLSGFHLLYQFNILPNAKIFNSFFQIQFIYLSYQNTGVTYKWIPYSTPAGYPHIETRIIYTSDWTVKDFFISYGLKLKFSKNFYISSNAGIGFIIDREHVYYEPGDSWFNYDYGDTRLSLMASLGLGYKFDCKK